MLGLKAGTGSEKWYAVWENPLPPWSDYFPGAVNNTLMVCQQREGTHVGEKIYYLTPPLMWKKPVRIRPNGLKPVVLQETWQSPESEILDEREAVLKENPSCPGQRTSFWTRRLDGSEAFTPQTVRVVSLSSTKGFEMDTILVSELAEQLDHLPPGGKMRIDGWLHPEYAKSLRIRFIDHQRTYYPYTGQVKNLRKRRMSYAYESYVKWQNAEYKWRQLLVTIGLTSGFAAGCRSSVPILHE